MAQGCAKRARGPATVVQKVPALAGAFSERDAKRARLNGIIEEHMKKVVEALGEALDREDVCKAMLQSMAQGCLAPGREERDEFQDEAVCIIGKALDQMLSRFEQRVARKDEILRDPEVTRGTMTQEEEAARKRIEEMDSELQAARQELASATNDVKSSQRTHEAARGFQSTLDETFKELSVELKSFEEAFASHFLPLRDGTFETKEDAARHVQSLTPMLKRFDYEDSLIAAFGPAAQHRPSERKHFDRVVFAEAEKGFLDLRNSIEQKVNETMPEAHRADKEVQEALEKELAAQQKEQYAALKVGLVSRSKASLTRALEGISEELQAFPQHPDQAQKERDAAKLELDGFAAGPYASFLWLRERVASFDL